MNSSKRQSYHGYGETDEWMTSQWRRGGERVWNWFGGRARGGVSPRVFVGQTHFSPLRNLVSSVDGLSLVRLRFFSIPPLSVKWRQVASASMIFALVRPADRSWQHVRWTERGHVCVLVCMDVMWCSRRATGNERKGRCAVQLSHV